MRPTSGKIWIFILTAAFLSGCASHQIGGLSAPAPQASVHRLFVATQRTPDQIRNLFGAKRTRPMFYGTVDVSVPPGHQPGQIEWPKGPADSRKDFAVVHVEPFTGAGEFRTRLARAPDYGSGVTNLYVHGFNTTIPEATFRLAQIRHDFEDRSPTVLFGWPSAGDPRAYVYDRDSVLFARDDLVQVLRDMTAKSNRKVTVLAHSIGAHLAMEALRQISLSGERHLLSRINRVVLVSPDIDPDVFRRQVEAIDPLPREFIVFVAKQDRALRLSAFLTGGRKRVGAITGPEDVAGLDVTVIDLSQLGDGKGGNHQVGLTSPAAIQVLKGQIGVGTAPQDAAPEFLVFGPQGP